LVGLCTRYVVEEHAENMNGDIITVDIFIFRLSSTKQTSI